MNKQELCKKIKKENTLDNIPGEDIVKYMPENIKNRKEEWKDIPGYGGFQVSDKGRVRYILDTPAFHKPYTTKNAIMALRNNGHGYFQVRGVWEYIHRLVALAFIPNPHHYSQVNHIDEIKKHNWKENLEWCSHKYNSNWGTTPHRCGSTNRGKHLTEETKIKISKTETGRKLSQETKNKISKGNKGKGKGVRLPESWRRHIGEAQLGTHQSLETRRKIGAGNRGKKATKEAIEHMRKAQQKNMQRQDIKDRISKKNSKPIVQLTMDGKIIKKWKNQTELCETLKCGPSPAKCCKGLKDSFRNCKWQYWKDYVKNHPEML